MNKLQNKDVLNEQYRDDKNLNKRISVHEKYSTNKMGFNNWIVSQYKFDKNYKVLELGCGNGDTWIKNSDILNGIGELVLSDFSEGMIKSAKQKLGNANNIDYEVIDIENIPYKNESFDAVIANMMLYHIPDLDKGLSEVKRVLKNNGLFYCATFGEHGIIEYVEYLITKVEHEYKGNKNFTLQTGKAKLEKYFSEIERKDYKDSLAVTNIDDLLEYIYSLSSMSDIKIGRAELKEILKNNMVNGVINIPKEYGMFISKK